MYSYWIQKHDYSSLTRDQANLDQTIAAYNNFDWQAEIDNGSKEEGKDCPPGMGINNGIPLNQIGGCLLHICPVNNSSVFFNFHYRIEDKFLLVFSSTKQVIHYVPEYSSADIEALIRLFFSGKYGKIVDIQ